MCGRVGVEFDAEMLAEVLGVAKVPAAVVQDRNIAPGTSLLVIRMKNGTRILSHLRWGLIPSWSKDPKIAWKLINARCETLHQKPAFREPFRHRRCVIPVTGFYEWKSSAQGRKQPFFIRRNDGHPMLLAGLWESWQGPEGLVETFTIITTTPNALVQPLHDRMPVILPPEVVADWIADTVLPREQIQLLFRPTAPDLLAIEEADLSIVGVEEVTVVEEEKPATEAEEPEQDVYNDLVPGSSWRDPQWRKGDPGKR